MHRLICKRYKSAGLCIPTLAALIALVISATPASTSTAAGPADFEHRLDVLSTQRVDDLRTLEEVEQRIVYAKREYRLALDNLEVRLVAIYQADAGSPLAAAMTGSSVSDAIDVAEAMRLVAEHDAAVVERFDGIRKQIPLLEERAARLRAAVRRAEAKIDEARTALRAEQQRADEALRAAEELSTVPKAPLTTPATSAESAEASVATGNSGSAPGYTESGTASVYSNSFTGAQTASGERYNPNAMTAAHKYLPLGTWVTVKAPGGSVLVRINDRGPFVSGRIIDLSAAAARAAGVNGLAHVTITVQS